MLDKQQLNKIVSKCDTAKQAWNSLYYEAMAYTQPERNQIWRTKDGFPGNNKQIPLYTQAGKNGTNIFVARVQNKLSPFLKPYINFKPKDSLESNFVKQLRDFCSVMSKKCNERKNEIRLDEQLNDAYYDLVCGTAMIMREDTLYGVKYRKIPFTEYKLGTEQNQTVCRDFCMPAYKVGVVFPELAKLEMIGNVSTKGTDKYNDVKLNDIMYFNEQSKLWEYYLRFGDDVLLFRKYKKSPFHIFHWTRASDMPFGTGVALQALPAMKRLNSYIKVKLELLPFSFPMFLTTSGNFMDRNVQFKPGGIINVRDINAMKPVELSTDRQNFMMEIESEELQIKQTFLDYTLPTDPRQMTAAEVYARSNPQDEMVTMNVSKLTQVIKDIALGLFEDVFNREIKGTVSFKLEDIEDMIDVEINNESTTDTNLIDKINGFITTVGQIDPTAVWQGLDRGKTIEKYAQAYNLPPELRRTAEEIDEAQQEQAEAQNQALQDQVDAQVAINDAKEQSVANREMAVKGAENG